jgi:hypothetical protein
MLPDRESGSEGSGTRSAQTRRAGEREAADMALGVYLKARADALADLLAVPGGGV